MRHWKAIFALVAAITLSLSIYPAVATDYYWDTGSGNWNIADNWDPSGPPGGSDSAYVGTLHADSRAWLGSGDAIVNFLSVEDDYGGINYVWTNGHRLLVYGTTNLTETTGSVVLYVASGAAINDFDTNYLNIYGGAELNMDGGLAQIDNRLFVDPSSYIIGYGTIEFNSSDTTALSLAGTLRTDHATESLTLQVTGGGKLDLDGSSGGNSVIDVTTGTSSLIIDGQLSDFFSGAMTIGEGNSVNFTQAWGTDGTINFNAGSGTATLNGAALTVYNRINANSGTGIIFADVTFNSGAAVTIASGARLRLDSGQTTYQGGSYTGAGTLAQDDIATIAADTTINTAYYDWDGVWGTSHTTVNSGCTFTINSTISDSHNGTVTVNGGTVVVNSPWTMAGVINLNPDAVLDGSRMTLASSGTLNFAGYPHVYAPVTIAGTVTVAPSGAFHDDTIFESTAVVNLSSGDYINLYGPTTYRGGTFSGNGMIRQNGNATVEANTTIGVTTFDWDGTGNNSQTTIDPGVSLIINSDYIQYSAGDNYNGTVNINGGRIIVNTVNPWALEGTMNLNNTGNIPSVYGTEMTVRDSAVGEGINVIGTAGNAWIQCPITFESTARVNVAAGLHLGLYNDTTYRGGSFTGDGRIYQYGDTVVEDNTTIDTAEFNWNAFVMTPMTTTIDPDVTFTINSSLYGNEVRSNVNINGGVLNVNSPSPWTLKGTMTIDNATNWGELHGSEMILAPASTLNLSSGKVYAPLTVEGTVNAASYGRLYGATVFESTANVNIPSGYLTLDGPTTFRGGSYTGAGILYQYDNAVVEADTTIDVDTYDWNHITTVNPGVNFTINSTSIQYGADNYFAGTVNVNNGATLAVNTTYPWELRGTMNLAGGQVTGKEIINEGTISGYGTIAAADLTNNGTLSANGGTLVINTISFPDLDGNAFPETGILEALNGNMRVMGNLGSLFSFNTELYVGSGREFRMDNYGLMNLGQIYLQGGNYVSPQFRQTNVLNVNNAASTINSDSVFSSGSTTTLNTDLRIVGSAAVNAGATFTGPGSLIITSGSLLTGDGNVGVNVINYGRFEPGASPAIFTIGGNYVQPSNGTLAIEIGGFVAGAEHDKVVVGGTAKMAGTLNLSLISGFMPNYNDKFEILTAGSAIGRFDLITGMAITPTLYLATVYNPDNITIVAAIPGDANFDVRVDGSDLNFLLTGWGTGDEWREGDFNGSSSVNGSDLNLLLSNWTYPPASAAVPEPVTLSLLVIGGLVLLKRTRKFKA